MSDPRRLDPLPSWALATFATLVGICSLRREGWPAASLPASLDLNLLFATTLCTSAAVRIARLLSRPMTPELEARESIRRMSRSFYLQIYLVIGTSEIIDLVRGPVSGHRSVSSLFKPAAFELGRLEPTRDLKLLVIYGLAAVVLTRLAASALLARQIRARLPGTATSAQKSTAPSPAAPPLRVGS